MIMSLFTLLTAKFLTVTKSAAILTGSQKQIMITPVVVASIA